MTSVSDHAFGRRPPPDKRLTRVLLSSRAARRGLLAYAGALTALMLVAYGEIVHGLEDALGAVEQADTIAVFLTVGLTAVAVLNCFLTVLILGVLYALALRVAGFGARLPHGTDAVAAALWPIAAGMLVAAAVGTAIGADAMFESPLVSVVMALAVGAHLVLLVRRAREFSGHGPWSRACMVVCTYVLTPALLFVLATSSSTG